MNIDRSNIEAWLLDRMEGRLTPEQERAVNAFLLANPGLLPDDDDLPALKAGPGAPLDKRSLKRFLPPTGAIDARNIDDYLIARQEGDLSAEQLQALDGYLVAHPELERTANLYAVTQVKSATVSFSGKAALSRTLPPQGLPEPARLDDFLVARFEGDLTLQQRTALDDLLKKDAAAANAWSLLSRARVAASDIAFPDKASLKKKEVRVVPLWSRQAVRYAAAASVALLLGLAWWLLREGLPVEPQFAQEQQQMKQPGSGARDHVPEQRAVATGKARTNAPEADGGSARAAHSPTQQLPEVAPGYDTVSPHHQGNEAPEPHSIERLPAERVERVEPMLARVEGGPSAQPLQGTVPDVPVSRDGDTPGAPAKEVLTVGELLASTMRKEVLDDPQAPTRKLDGDDAVALVDKGLNAVGGDRAGFAITHENGRRRFNLRLGRDLSITASTGR